MHKSGDFDLLRDRDFHGRDNVGSLPFGFSESSHSFLRSLAVLVSRLFTIRDFKSFGASGHTSPCNRHVRALFHCMVPYPQQNKHSQHRQQPELQILATGRASPLAQTRNTMRNISSYKKFKKLQIGCNHQVTALI